MSKLNRGGSSDRLGERVEFRFSSFRAVQDLPLSVLQIQLTCQQDTELQILKCQLMKWKSSKIFTRLDRAGRYKSDVNYVNCCTHFTRDDMEAHINVPVVSDRLLIRIISVDSRRTIAKSSKAAARNGTCEWPDSILESIWFSQDEVSKEIQECQYKITVSMGSTKTAILGEVFLNLTNYLSSSDPAAISLPLKRCNSSTVLQLQIQCLGTKSKSSEEPWNELSTRLDDDSRADNDMDRKSDGSDSMLDISSLSLPGNYLGDAYEDEDGNRDASFLPPETCRSSNCGDGSINIRNLSPVDNSNEGLYMRRQDSASSASHDSAGRGDDSSKGLLDTSEETTEEVRDEAHMWESHSPKLKIELDTSKNECDDKSKEQAELALEFSASHSEQKSSRQEIEELKSYQEEVTPHQSTEGTPKSRDEVVLQKLIIDEVQFLKESNANLTAQLNKTQEANIELVSILQELEETIELQRVEMFELSRASDMVDHEVSKSDLAVQEDTEWARILSLKDDEITTLREKLDRILSIENVDGAGPDAIYLELEKENDFLKEKIHELQNDCSELTDENLELIYKLKEVSEVAKGEDSCISNSEEMPNVWGSTSNVKYLEQKCADLELNILKFSSEFSELEEKFQKSQKELKERTLELSELREKLFQATELERTETGSAARYHPRSGEPDDTESDLDAVNCRVLLKEQEIEGLQHSAKELENIISDIGKEKSQLEERLAAAIQESNMTSKCLDKVREDLLELTRSVDSHVSTNKVLETKISELEICKFELESHVTKLEHEKVELADTGKGKSQLEERLAAALQESSMTSKCLDEVREDLLELTRSVDSHVSTNKVLETKISELEICKFELKSHVTKLEHENVELSDTGKEKSQLEERLAAALQESCMTSKCLDAVREDLLELTRSVDSHVSTNKVLETKISELEICKFELELHVTKLEHEIVELSDIGKEKSQLEERLAVALQENSMTSKCLHEVREDLLELTRTVDSHVSTNKILEKKISELEICKFELESQVTKLEHEDVELSDTGKKSQLEERLAAALQESSMTSKCLDEVREDPLELTRTVDSHVSINKVLETKISELEICKFELESHVTKLERENVELSDGKEKSQLEERLAVALQESSMTSKCLDVVREDLLELKRSVDSHVSTNKVLQTKISELEICKLELESHVTKLEHENVELSDTVKEKSQLEERLAAALQESSMTSKCLDEVREDLLELTRSVDSHVSTNKVLETKISDLEICKFELESHVAKLEYENVELSEFITEIEAQLISLTSENESTKLEMNHSISIITNLTDIVEQQQEEMEGQKLELMKRHLESQRRLSEVQEDSEALRRLNVKLQGTIDCVVEECNCLKTMIADLKKQKLELHDHSTELEQKLEQSKRKTIDFCSTVEFLEVKLSSLQKDASSKEQSLLSELENIFQEHKEHEERIDRAHFLLNKIENEKIVEVRNLEREVTSLTAQLSSTDGERESATSDSIHEVSILRADKAKLEANLEDVSTQMRHYESQLEDLRKESKSKIKGLVDSLSTSKQNEETLTTDVEHMRKLMEAARSNEENLRKTSGELELKYKSCDYEKQQIIEEVSELKNQVLKMASIQDELFKLQSFLDEAKVEKGKLEDLMQSLSEECKELKAQKAVLTDKVSCMQSSLHDADEGHSKSAEANIDIKQGHDASNDNGGTPVNEGPSIQSKIQLLEARLVEALEENKWYKAQLQSPTGEEQSGSKDGKETNDGSKIAQLESELKYMQERLLNVSMQYAEVEAQREDLVMELKNVNAKKGRWF